MATIKSEYYRFNGVSWDLHYFKTTIDQVVGLQTALDGKLDAGSTGYVKHDDVLMPTNPFGGRKLYINSIDNAMHAADKKWVVIITRHLVSYNGETYPKLNPDYVSEYTLTGTGSSRTITNSPKPSNIVVYENDVLKYEATHYSYNASTGVITFTYTPSGTIRVYPGHEIPQYIDSPVYNTESASGLFDGSYETNVQVANGYYMKVRITPSDDGYTGFGGYPYGTLYLSYYYTGTPDKAEYRTYNYSYRPHVVGWKKYDMSDFIGTKTGANYVQRFDDQGNYGRTIMEFIIYGHDTSGGAYTTSLSQIDWKQSRPNLSSSGSTVTKYGTNKLFYDLKFGDRTSDKVVIEANGSIKINGQSVYHPGNFPIALTDTNQKIELGGTTQYIRLAYGGKSQAFIKHSEGVEYEVYTRGSDVISAITSLAAPTIFANTISSDGGSIAFSGGLDYINFSGVTVINVPEPQASHHPATKDYVDKFAAPVATKTASATLALTDMNKFIYVNSGSALTFTIPPNSSVAFPVGTEIHFLRYGTGEVSLAPGAGVTLQSEGSKRRINAQYQVVTIKKILTDTWALFGALKS